MVLVKCFSLDIVGYNHSTQVVDTTYWFVVINSYSRFWDLLFSLEMFLSCVSQIASVFCWMYKYYFNTFAFASVTPADDNKLSVANFFIGSISIPFWGFHNQRPSGKSFFFVRVPKESVWCWCNSLKSSGTVYKLSTRTL